MRPQPCTAAFCRLPAADPDGFLAMDDATLRACGFSRQKMGYARGLAAKVAAGEFDFTRLAEADDATAEATLRSLKGIGRWSAEVYLIFALGRADIWPAADLGLQMAVRDQTGVGLAASRAGIAGSWRCMAAVAYCRRLPVLAVLFAQTQAHPSNFGGRTLCLIPNR